jgi:hypothetical protein
MPLQSGSSRAAFEHNVGTEVAAGKPQKQAVAIAYREKGEDSLSSIFRDALDAEKPKTFAQHKMPEFRELEKNSKKLAQAAKEGMEAARALRFSNAKRIYPGESLSVLARDAVFAANGLSDFYTAPTREGPLSVYLKYGGGDRGEVGDSLSRIARERLLGARDGLADLLEKARGGIREQTE